MTRLGRDLSSVAAVALFFVALGFVLGPCAALVACTPPASAQQAAAEGAYGAALLRCVDEAETLAESKACRARVDEAWGITQTAVDGGAK